MQVRLFSQEQVRLLIELITSSQKLLDFLLEFMHRVMALIVIPGVKLSQRQYRYKDVTMK